jgi:hypothetical protein
MASDGDDAKGRGQFKRPYEPPRIESEAVFETTALACGKIGGQGGKCTTKPKAS